MKMTIRHENRIFEAHVSNFGFGLADVNFYEVVRPTWKIFRTSFFPFGSTYFWVEDYESVLLAVQDCLDECLAEEAHEKEVATKWENFEKAIDKTPRA